MRLPVASSMMGVMGMSGCIFSDFAQIDQISWGRDFWQYTLQYMTETQAVGLE